MTVPGTITIHLWIVKSRTHFKLGMVEKFPVPVLLDMTFIDSFIKSMNPVERRIVYYQTLPIPMLMIQETRSTLVKKEASAVRH